MGEKPNEPDKIWKEIAELKESQENDHMVIKNLVSSLDILGEQQEALHQAITNESIVNLRLEAVLRDALETKKRNAEKHLAELVDDPQIEAKFIKACEKQIEDAKRQLEKLDSDPVQKRIDALDEGGKILKKHEEALNSKASGGNIKFSKDPLGIWVKGKFYPDSDKFPDDEKLPEPWPIENMEFTTLEEIEESIPKTKEAEPEKYPKVVYQLGSDSKEYIELKKKYDKLIEEFITIVSDLYLRDDDLAFMETKQELEGRLNK